MRARIGTVLLAVTALAGSPARAQPVGTTGSSPASPAGTATPRPDESDEDDPKHDHGSNAIPRPVPWSHFPSIKLSYRFLVLPNLDRSALPMHAGQLDMYPISARWFRVSIEAELGTGSGELLGKPNSAWYLLAGLGLGFQHPGRITPFLDARFAAGFIGGDVAGTTAISYAWMGGLDGGVEIYLTGRLFVSLAIGWVHALYHGIDYLDAQAHPLSEPNYIDLSTDTYTIKVGLGL